MLAATLGRNVVFPQQQKQHRQQRAKNVPSALARTTAGCASFATEVGADADAGADHAQPDASSAADAGSAAAFSVNQQHLANISGSGSADGSHNNGGAAREATDLISADSGCRAQLQRQPRRRFPFATWPPHLQQQYMQYVIEASCCPTSRLNCNAIGVLALIMAWGTDSRAEALGHLGMSAMMFLIPALLMAHCRQYMGRAWLTLFCYRAAFMAALALDWVPCHKFCQLAERFSQHWFIFFCEMFLCGPYMQVGAGPWLCVGGCLLGWCSDVNDFCEWLLGGLLSLRSSLGKYLMACS